MKKSLVNQGCNADVRSDKIETIYNNGNLGRGIFDSYRVSVQKTGHVNIPVPFQVAGK